MPARTNHWLHSSPLYAPFLTLPRALTQTRDISLLNHHARELNICNANGLPIQFVLQQANMGYETHINSTGEIPTRTDNWHDYFNALAWLIWPRTKAVLNDLHLRAGITSTRNRPRDALTLLDESGVIVACSDTQLWQQLAQHQWQDLFIDQRERVKANMAFHLLGHALYEKLRHPYPSITGKCTLISVTADFFQHDTYTRQQHLDQQLAQQLSATPPLTASLFPPLPLLGIPDAVPENAYAAYYQNRLVFR
ncbi:MAG: DUF3025 domain-containing protein [Sulfuriferula sp.]|nr:DUF3025 domain-containing protein [Sulfuriferula sp.]